MKSAPLLSALLAFSSSALAGPQPADPPAPPPLTANDRTFLEGEGFDPKYLSPAAVKAAQADPARFHEDYALFLSWRKNDKLLHAAAGENRAEVERSIGRMSGFLTPAEGALLQSNLRLAPHALDARVSKGPGFEGGGGPLRAGSDSSAVSAAPSRSPSAAGTNAADFRVGPRSLTTPAPPAAAPRAAPPPAEKPWWQDSLDFYYCRLYPDRCGR